MRFGNIQSIMMLGGGQLLADFSIACKKQGRSVVVVTSPRHAEELIEDGGEKKPLRDVLASASVECIVTRDISTDAEVAKRITPNVIAVSIGAAWIFKKDFISKFEGRLLNLHGRRLPKDRGAGDFSWMIMVGNRAGASLLHLVDEGLDTGALARIREFTYPETCRIPEDYRAYSRAQDAAFLEEFIKDVFAGTEFTLTTQDETVSTYWPRLNTDMHGWIDWSWGHEDIARFISAFDDPFKGASTFLNGMRVYSKKSSVSTDDGAFHPFQSGIIYRIHGHTAFVATRTGTVAIQEIVGENGEDLFSRLRPGDRLATPQEKLDAARAYRAVYTPDGLKK